jgi:glycosyltransferase involved in cell wall biosynthesis
MVIKVIDSFRHRSLQSGYGQMADAIYSGLESLGHTVYWQDTKEKVDLNLWVRPPHYIKEPYFKEEENNVFFTMHEEETFEGWKSDWPKLINKCKAAIFPTDWCRQVFIKNGVTIPTFVCPLGVSTKRFKPNEDRRFSVLMVHEALGSPGSREDWKSNVEAIKFFADRADIKFTVKTWRSDFVEQLPNTDIYNFEFVEEDMARLYRQHDVFIKNSKKEGWSVPMSEAMASGLTIIAADTPTLKENARQYPVKWFDFGKPNQLIELLNKEHRLWKEKRSLLDQFDWKQSVSKLDEILKQIPINK